MAGAGIFFISIIISPLIISFIIAFSGPQKASIPGIELNIRKKQRFERVRWIFNEQFPANDCPVMFLRGAVLKDKTTGKNLLQLKFINAGTQTIKSAYAAIDFIDDAGDIIANGTTIQAEYLDVNCASGDTFGQKQLLDLGDIGALHIVITYSKVVFTDGTVWRVGTDSQASRPIPVILLKNVLPSELQNEVSEETLCKPKILGGGLWRCTCGCLVRTADGNACPNCQQTFGQAQESASVSVLEKRKQQRIAEQEQAALDEQVAKKQSKNYAAQFVLSVIALYLGTVISSAFVSEMVADKMEIHIGILQNIIGVLYFGIYIGGGCISLIATAYLVRMRRKDGKIREDTSSGKVIKIQGITALLPGVFYGFICLIAAWKMVTQTFETVGLFTSVLILSIICLIPNFLYWLQLPYIREGLKREKVKRIRERIALVVCGIAVLFATVCIAHVPSCMHFYMGGGFSFDSYIVLPCIISVIVAAVSIIYCRRLPIVKDWLAKRKSGTREK